MPTPNDRSFVEVQPGGPVTGTIRPPGSKSLTNRALICAALADGPSVLRGALQSDDTRVMVEGLRQIGVTVEQTDGGSTIRVLPGRTGQSAGQTIEIEIGNSGTTIRFLTAALSALGGDFRLSGVPRMHQRPIGDLIDAVNRLGCDVSAESEGGCPPVRIRSQGWTGSQTSVAGSVSSQYLSGLLMAAPASGREVRIDIAGELVSRPYVDMTIALMRQFGARVSEPNRQSLVVDGTQTYRGQEVDVEPDASAASYHWAAAAITGGKVTVEGLHRDALQGDVHFVDVLEKMGCRVEHGENGITVSGRAARGIDVDMNPISDCVQTLAVVALMADGPTTIRGVGHNRFKETDRIGDLATELRKLGAIVEEREDGLTITPGPRRAATIETYDDHRMAMCFALAGLVIPKVRIVDPACTAKTYPNFFSDLERLIGRPHHWGRTTS
jgi:3-phosphoshikimate 1-carboxyvinyltransferase